MGIDRRKFLKIAGISTMFGLGGKTAIDLLSPGELDAAIKNVPLTKASKWAMVVNMHKMTDEILDKCREACHIAHNIPDWGNERIEIKWNWKDNYEHTFPGQGHEYLDEHIMEKNYFVLCNHCDNPPCCRVCPTKATWKREDGIVMMDPHRCIGCRFCMAACPFGARSFNWGDPRKAPSGLNPEFPTNEDYPTRTKGVVEKCNFCAERISAGLVPYCVEAANAIEEGTLTFGDLDDYGSNVRRLLRSRYSIRRKPELGTGPNIYYIV
jgi:molybdopterin-containing oxidoreductase family iron-sulfur binding subunit